MKGKVKRTFSPQRDASSGEVVIKGGMKKGGNLSKLWGINNSVRSRESRRTADGAIRTRSRRCPRRKENVDSESAQKATSGFGELSYDLTRHRPEESRENPTREEKRKGKSPTQGKNEKSQDLV